MNNNCNSFLNPCCNKCCRRNYCENNFIPGPPGPQGPAGTNATIAIGTTTTSNPGTNASVTNTGTTNNAVLNFTIPRGNTGPIGPQGPTGEAATITIGTTTTLPYGSQATVTNSGTSSNAILNFGIPTGSANEIASGSFISRNQQTFNIDNSIITLPIILNNNGITINNSILTITKTGRYIIDYGINSTTIGNIVVIYINGINNINSNLQTNTNNTNPSSSIILQLNELDNITLGAVNATSSNPLTLQPNTINAYITIMSID